MKKTIFTFFIFVIIITLFSSCSTYKKGGCGCPGSSNNIIKINFDIA